jgi:hypothetical protein
MGYLDLNRARRRRGLPVSAEPNDPGGRTGYLPPNQGMDEVTWEVRGGNDADLDATGIARKRNLERDIMTRNPLSVGEDIGPMTRFPNDNDISAGWPVKLATSHPLNSRPRVVDPESYTGESPDVVEAGSSAQQVRPKIADPEQFTEDRIDTLQHMPLEHVGFKRRAGMALENFGQAITQGLQNAAAYGHPLSTYDAMNLIGAGISSGAPMLAGRVASRAVRDEEVGQNRERLLNFDQARQRRAAREDATLKRAQGVATFNKTVAETDRLVHPKPDVQLVKGKGGWFAVDKNDIGSKPTKLPIDPDSPDTPPRQFEHMGVRYETVKDDTGKWVTRAVEGLPTDESAVPVPYKPTADSPTFMVRPADAVRGATEIEGANIQANAQGGANAVAAANENADREYQTKLAAWKLEGDRASDYNTLKDKRDEAERRFNAAQKILLSVDPAALKVQGQGELRGEAGRA